MRRTASLFPLSIAALATWLTPTAADACSCYLGEVLLWPQGGELAENEAILLGQDLSDCGKEQVDPWETSAIEHGAFVDGQAVELVELDDRPGFALEPAPSVGSTVTIARCGYDNIPCDLDTVDPEARWDLTVVAAVDGGPAAPTLANLDYELAEFENCGAGIVKARDWTIDLTPDSDKPRMHEIRIGPEGEQTQRYVFTESTEVVEYTIRRTEEDAGKTVCATVRTFDMAGNESPEVSSCDELGRYETLDRAGCACTTSPNAPPTWIVTLALLLIRRRP